VGGRDCNRGRRELSHSESYNERENHSKTRTPRFVVAALGLSGCQRGAGNPMVVRGVCSVQAVINASQSRCSARYDTPLHDPMTLVIAIRTASRVIVAADSLSYNTDLETGANLPFAQNKLHSVAGTDWVMASAGNAVFDTLKREVETEIELGQRPPFDPHLEIGGPAFLRTLAEKARQENPVEIPQCWIALCGFDTKKKPLVLTANPPRPGYMVTGQITALGAQWPTATWILNLLAGSCPTIEAARKLACFTIWQISKQELKVGTIEAGYPISSCVLEYGKPAHFGETSREALDGWLAEWEQSLQDCFMQAIKRIESTP
jgi:hypothetical protein